MVNRDDIECPKKKQEYNENKPCPERYKNLGLSSFGEQKYVTADMLRQFCMNDAFLKRQTDNLKYLSPPAIRKRYTPIDVNSEKSWGYQINSDNTVSFSNSTQKNIYIDFSDTSLIDFAKSEGIQIHSFTKENDDGTKSVIQQVELKPWISETVDKTTRDYSPWTIRDKDGNIISDDMTCNEHWYVGYDRNREYHIQPNWLENILNTQIPSIGRAQTFKANKTGKLDTVVLNLKVASGQDKANTGSPLIVQIRNVEDKEGIAYPESRGQGYYGSYPVLAEERVRFTNSSPEIASIHFTHPPNIVEGQKYAIVVLSPLSHPNHCYWIGGWNKHCKADMYPDGDAFYTFDNGYHWTRYGKDSKGDEYHHGRYAPQDFAFQVFIAQEKQEYKTNTDAWLYLTPIRANQIRGISISAKDRGDTADGNVLVEYQVSTNGRDWHVLSKDNTYLFDEKHLRNIVFVRARLITKREQETPIIQMMNITLTTNPAEELYVRTNIYRPPVGCILGANVWGKINAPYTLEPNTEGSVEIIRDFEVSEEFTIIRPIQLEEYLELRNQKGEKFINENKVTIKPFTPNPNSDANQQAEQIRVNACKGNKQVYDYLKANPEVLEELSRHRIYVGGYSDEKWVWHDSMFDRFHFLNDPANPIIACSVTPFSASRKAENFGEWYDYQMDYAENELIWFEKERIYDEETGEEINTPVWELKDKDVLRNLAAGTYKVTYNPVFLSGIVNDEMPVTLDYFVEEELVSKTMLEEGKFKLRTAPVDPIREVIVNPEQDSEKELYEDVNFTVDYDRKEIIFDLLNDETGETIIQENDILRIVYTPNLDDAGLSLGYTMRRSNLDNDVTIQANYIEYKS